MSDLRNETGSRSLTTNYLRVLREQWIIVGLAVVLCVAGGVIGRNLLPTNYKAETDLLISPIDNTDDTYVGISLFRNTSSDPTSNVLTLARYIDTPVTAQRVKAALHLSESASALLGSIGVKPLSQTDIVSIDATASSPQLAARIADAFARATIARRTQDIQSDVAAVMGTLQTQISRSNSAALTGALQTREAALRALIGLPDPTVAVLNTAQVPTVPDKPSTALVVIATAMMGLLVGFGAALFTDTLGGKIRREDELLLRDRLPVLARVPRLSEFDIREYLAGRENLPPAAWESYRTLRTNLLRTRPASETPVILVTSAMSGEGKTLTAMNLAITLAAQDMQVLLVDGDFRRPMLASIFKVPPPRNGFASAFMNGNVNSAIMRVPGYANLKVLLPSLSNMSQIDQLDPDRIAALFDKLRSMAHVVVVDSAPATEVSDGLLLASAADMTVIAVRMGFSKRSRLDSLRESLAQYGVSPAGLVLTTRSAPDYIAHGSTMPVPVELKAPRTRARVGRSKQSR